MKFSSLHFTDAPYRHAFGDYNILGFAVYTEQNESIGKVVDVLIDQTERSYYFAVEHRSLLSQERFILPLTACKIATSEQRIYVIRLSKAQLKNLPEYHKENVARYNHGSNQPAIAQMEPLPVEASLPLEYSRPLESGVGVVDTQPHRTGTPSVPPAATHSTPVLENPVATNAPLVPLPIENAPLETNQALPIQKRLDYDSVERHNIKLLAERLVVDRRRRKVGEVVVRKVIETQMVNVPVRREKLIVERVSPEHTLLGAIELDHGELSQAELRKLIPGLSDDAIQSVADQASIQTPLPKETVPIQTALQILQQVHQVAQFKHATVKLVFNNEELQRRYQRWLAEHK